MNERSLRLWKEIEIGIFQFPGAERKSEANSQAAIKQKNVMNEIKKIKTGRIEKRNWFDCLNSGKLDLIQLSFEFNKFIESGFNSNNFSRN